MSRDRFGSPVSFPILRLNLVLAHGIHLALRGGVHLLCLCRQPPSDQSRVYRVTQLRTDGLHCREASSSQGTSCNRWCLFKYHHGPINVRLFFPTPTFCLWSLRIFPSLLGSRLANFYRDASSALLQLVNQWLYRSLNRTECYMRRGFG